MFNNNKKDWSEKWVLEVGKKAFALGRYSKLFYLLLFTCATIMAFMLFFLIIKMRKIDEGVILIAIFAGTTVISLFLAIQTFERRHFYRIINEQKEKIEQLEKELQEKH